MNNLKSLLKATLFTFLVVAVSAIAIQQIYEVPYDYRLTGVKVMGTSGHGSGVIVDSNAVKTLVITNKHVCNGITYDRELIRLYNIQGRILFFARITGDTKVAQEAAKEMDRLKKLLEDTKSNKVTIKMNISKKTFEAQIFKVYPHHDLCLVELPFGNLPVVRFSNLPHIPGQRVIAFGNPLNMENHFTEGFVGDTFEHNGKDYIHHTAPIHPGNSGSGTYDMNGNLVGINTIGNPQVKTQSGMISWMEVKLFLDGKMLKDRK